MTDQRELSRPALTVSWGTRQALTAGDGVPVANSKPIDTFLGHLDGVSGGQVEGWICSKTHPGATLVVEIFDGVRKLGACTASLYREDLLDAGIGDGRHCFRFAIPPELFDGRLHDIEAREQHSGFRLKNGRGAIILPRRIGDGPVGQFSGRFNAVGGRVASGRVYDAANPAAPPPEETTTAAAPPAAFHATVVTALRAMADALNAQSAALAAQAAVFDGLLARLAQKAGSAPADASDAAGAAPPAISSNGSTLSDFVFFSVIDWHVRIQRPQHLARCLAALGHRVFYLSVRIADIGATGMPFQILSEPTPGVLEIGLCCHAPVPNVHAGIADPHQLGELASALAQVAKQLELRAPIAVVQYPAWYPLAITLPGITVVYDCLDYVGGFSSVLPRVVALEEELTKGADCVIVTSRYLAERAERWRRCETVRNGADVAYFCKRPRSVFRPQRRPVIGFYGAIAEWFDAELLAASARLHPDWLFLLIGSPEGCDLRPFDGLSNIQILGETPYDRLSHYLYSFDVCIVPFKLSRLIEATDPVKIYEYLCSGRPIVATAIPELRNVPPGLISVARTRAEFDRLLGLALEERDKTLTARRKAWAKQQAWEARTTLFRAAIGRQFPEVSVVIVGQDGADDTALCLNSVFENSDYPNLEIICVDNGSRDRTDGLLRVAAACQANLVHIRNEANPGFASDSNSGIKAARGDIVILLSNAAYVTRGWIRDLIRPLLLHKEIGLSGPLTNIGGNAQTLSIAYRDMAEMLQKSSEFTATRRRRIFDADRLAFFCVAIRRDVIDKVGYLCEDYDSGSFEGDDYCAAVRKAGYRIVICDDVFVHHHHSSALAAVPTVAHAELRQRNRRIFERKWGPWTAPSHRAEEAFGD